MFAMVLERRGPGASCLANCPHCKQPVVFYLPDGPVRGQRAQMVMQHECVCGNIFYALTCQDGQAVLCQRCEVSGQGLELAGAVELHLDTAGGASVVGGHHLKPVPLVVGRNAQGELALLGASDIAMLQARAGGKRTSSRAAAPGSASRPVKASRRRRAPQIGTASARGDKKVFRSLATYVRELRDEATTHCKVNMLLSCGIVLGCTITQLREWIVGDSDSLTTRLVLGLQGLLLAWLVAFSIGVWFRKRKYTGRYPPYDMIGRVLIPGLAFGTACATGFSMAFTELKTPQAVFFGGISAATVTLVAVLLFWVHQPLTRKAIEMTRDPNVAVVDSHRHMWLFPALGVLAVSLIGWLGKPEEAAMVPTAVAAATGTWVCWAGFGSGYIP